VDRSANVRSVDALKQLRTALLVFEASARDALTMLVLEVRKAIDWLENDRTQYWPEQYRQASEAMVEARSELERRQLTYGSEEPPSCIEQKKALERAKRRVRLCEEKIKAVKRWIRAVRNELHEFEGQVARMNECLDTDLPRAAAYLERLAVALDKYLQTTAAPPPPPAASAQRAGDGGSPSPP
jgi:hypothetical protein